MTTRSRLPLASARFRALRRASGAAPAAVWLLAGAALFAAVPAGAQAFPDEHAALEVHLDRTAYPPGSTALLAGVLAIDDGWHVNAHVPTFDWLIPTELTVETPAGWPIPSVRYPEPVHRTFAFAEEQPLAVWDGTAIVLAPLAIPAHAAPGRHRIAVQVLYQACDDRSCAQPVTVSEEVELTVGEAGMAVSAALFDGGPRLEIADGHAAGEPAGAGAGGGAARPAGGRSLAAILLLGMLGGLILNAMPCVLPVLSLKVLGLVQSAGHGRSAVTLGALATTAGILASFLALALLAIGARAAGAAVGWGVQFQQPGFVAFLAVVVVLFCLNLWGLFEIPLPGRLANALGGGPQEGVAGHFAAGLFATLMATPCSAPFLGTAMGFALAQPAAVVVATFAAVGVGMSLPYLALAVAPGAARLLPRPGAWMDAVRKVMGFLLAAAAVWLFYVLSAQIGPGRLALVQLALLGLALFVWMRGRAARTAAGRRWAALGIAGAAVATLLAAALPGAAVPAAGVGSQVVALIPWLDFDREEAESLASERLVFVDVTADWCFTCKTNERLVLETEEVASLFEAHGVVPMKADWTNRDDEIAAFLAAHGRYSIPFYLLYRPGEEPHLFSELLTKGAVAEAVRGASPSGG
jgi:suppressor for copper-sensitivity B